MTQSFKLLIAIDGSESAMDAVAYTSHFFDLNAVSITLIHVMPELPEFLEDLNRIKTSDALNMEMDKWHSQMKVVADQMMASALKSLINAGFSQTSIDLKIQQRQEGVAKDIIAESEKDYDVILIGRRGADNPTDTIVGATAYRMMSGIKHLPVAVVGEKPDPNHVLIGFDGSDNSFAAVDCVCNLMAKPDRKVMLCHVGQSIGSYLDGKNVISDEQAKVLQAQGRQQIMDLMGVAKNRLVDAGFDDALISMEIVEARVVSRAVAIAKTAEMKGYGTIVIGRRGLSVIEDFLMGRVSMKVLHRAHEMAVWIV